MLHGFCIETTMGRRDMRCIMHRSGGSNMHYQTTAFVLAIVEDHPVGNSVMPRITLYENDDLSATSKESIVRKKLMPCSPHK
jgi:hypothetical protein